jgi:outer membrane protein OmpA-like peptidoglycan-associated protein
MKSINKVTSGDRRGERQPRRRHLGAMIAAAWPLVVYGGDAVVSDAQIEQALQAPPATPAPPATAMTRGLGVRARTETKQMIDLNIPFEFNSSELQPQATAQLLQLRSALTSPGLSKDRFMVAGHTDAKGNPQYNQHLSERRAEAVRRYLVENGVEPQRLQAVGYGAEHLAQPDHPEDAVNRRVEIRNLGEMP